jgi:signal transduction histidine kinase
MGDLVRSTSGPRVSVNLAVGDDLKPAIADANQLEMALLNLSVNARDAMPDGGQLSIAVELATTDDQGDEGVSPGDYVRLSVTDTGTGMDEATLARAVEPFFSGKGHR